jgi:hypothetical protein
MTGLAHPLLFWYKKKPSKKFTVTGAAIFFVARVLVAFNEEGECR